jgi:predicted DNA binding CopG/RHH family protein
MKPKMKYTETPDEFKASLERAVQIEDFLPPPDQLFSQESMKKITIQLSASSVNYFKKLAQEFKIPYQQMIRKVLDSYVENYSAKNSHKISQNQ